MFDIGWLELLIIGIVALIVVGPEDLPGMFRTVGQFMGRMRGMAREFQRSMEEAARESGLKDAADGLNKIHDVTSPLKTAKNQAKGWAAKAGGLDDLDDIAKDLTDIEAEAKSTAKPPTDAGKDAPAAKPADAAATPAKTAEN